MTKKVKKISDTKAILKAIRTANELKKSTKYASSVVLNDTGQMFYILTEEQLDLIRWRR